MKNFNIEKFHAAEGMMLSRISRETTRIQNIQGIAKFGDIEAEVQLEDYVIQRDGNWVGMTLLVKLHFNAEKSGQANQRHDSRNGTEL